MLKVFTNQTNELGWMKKEFCSSKEIFVALTSVSKDIFIDSIDVKKSVSESDFFG